MAHFVKQEFFMTNTEIKIKNRDFLRFILVGTQGLEPWTQ